MLAGRDLGQPRTIQAVVVDAKLLSTGPTVGIEQPAIDARQIATSLPDDHIATRALVPLHARSTMASLGGVDPERRAGWPALGIEAPDEEVAALAGVTWRAAPGRDEAAIRCEAERRLLLVPLRARIGQENVSQQLAAGTDLPQKDPFPAAWLLGLPSNEETAARVRGHRGVLLREDPGRADAKRRCQSASSTVEDPAEDRLSATVLERSPDNDEALPRKGCNRRSV